MNDNANHDPIDRQIAGEPRFVLLARDPLAAGFARLYAVMRERNYDRAGPILEAVIRAHRAIPPAPHKDTSHAWSARSTADAMEMWRIQNMRGDEPTMRVLPALDEVFRPVPTQAEIRAARPPAEPEEAT